MLRLGCGDDSVAFCVFLRCGGSNTDIVPLTLARILGACDKVALFPSLFETILPLPNGFCVLPAGILLSGFVCVGSGSASSESDRSRSKDSEFATGRVEVAERGFWFGTVGSWTDGRSLRSWTAGWFLRSTRFVATLSKVATCKARGSKNGHPGLQARWRVPACLLTLLGFLCANAHPHSWGQRCSLDAEEDIVGEWGLFSWRFRTVVADHLRSTGKHITSSINIHGTMHYKV